MMFAGPAGFFFIASGDYLMPAAPDDGGKRVEACFMIVYHQNECHITPFFQRQFAVLA